VRREQQARPICAARPAPVDVPDPVLRYLGEPERLETALYLGRAFLLAKRRRRDLLDLHRGLRDAGYVAR
jgi:hypothetical protein